MQVVLKSRLVKHTDIYNGSAIEHLSLGVAGTGVQNCAPIDGIRYVQDYALLGSRCSKTLLE